MRLNTLIILILVIMGCGCCSAQKIASWQPAKSDNMQLLDIPDGRWQQVKQNGRDCIINAKTENPQSMYLYFALSPEARAKTGRDVWLVLEYFDSGFSMLCIEYNSTLGAYKNMPAFYVLGGGGWRKALVKLSDIQGSWGDQL